MLVPRLQNNLHQVPYLKDIEFEAQAKTSRPRSQWPEAEVTSYEAKAEILASMPLTPPRITGLIYTDKNANTNSLSSVRRLRERRSGDGWRGDDRVIAVRRPWLHADTERNTVRVPALYRNHDEPTSRLPVA